MPARCVGISYKLHIHNIVILVSAQIWSNILVNWKLHFAAQITKHCFCVVSVIFGNYERFRIWYNLFSHRNCVAWNVVLVSVTRITMSEQNTALAPWIWPFFVICKSYPTANTAEHTMYYVVRACRSQHASNPLDANYLSFSLILFLELRRLFFFFARPSHSSSPTPSQNL